MKIINVAEKPSVAKTISALLSHKKTITSTANKYVKNITFAYTYGGQPCTMVFTSVLGHLKSLVFARDTRWTEIDPLCLFSEPIAHTSDRQISANIRGLVRDADLLLIWTDCDREGENIGREIREVAWEERKIPTRRARFCGISKREVEAALRDLQELNEHEADAVDLRMELDLRIGSAITRMQTLGLALGRRVISYGSCQIPTLGFVVHRQQLIDSFFEEEFYSLQANVRKNRPNPFGWARGRIFDKNCVLNFCEFLSGQNDQLQGLIAKVTKAEKVRFKPLPLRTVELQRKLSRMLKISSQKIMELSEALYNKGYISYPRTETDTFPANFAFGRTLENLLEDPHSGEFARMVRADMKRPRSGKNNDQAHMPIYPVKAGIGLQGLEREIYNFVARRFLACLSDDAVAEHTEVEFAWRNEVFRLEGLRITKRNYLDVYPYDKWEERPIDAFREGERFVFTRADPQPGQFGLQLTTGKTAPPEFLTESDLIALMDRNGIGTDATIHEHIEKIQKRRYAVKRGSHLVPTDLGVALIRGYEEMGLSISYPDLRRELESGLKLVCVNRTDGAGLLVREIERYRVIYKKILEGIDKIKRIYLELADGDQSEDKKNFDFKGDDESMDLIKTNESDGDDESIELIKSNKVNEGCIIKGNKVNKGTIIKSKENMIKSKEKLIKSKDNLIKTNEGVVDIKVVKKRKKLKTTEETNFKKREKEGIQKSKEQKTKSKSSARNAHIKENTSNMVPKTDPPLCMCRKESKIGTVAKRGKNNGKLFYSCACWPHGCSFFQWIDCPREVKVIEDERFRCHCGYFSEMKVSNTEKNKGRRFLKCKKVYRPCGYFKWLD